MGVYTISVRDSTALSDNTPPPSVSTPFVGIVTIVYVKLSLSASVADNVIGVTASSAIVIAVTVVGTGVSLIGKNVTLNVVESVRSLAGSVTVTVIASVPCQCAVGTSSIAAVNEGSVLVTLQATWVSSELVHEKS